METTDRDRLDGRIREMFRASRTADRAVAPGFRTLVGRVRPGPQARSGVARWLPAAALLATVAVIVTAGASLWIALRAPESLPEPPPMSLASQAVAAPPSPPPPPAPRPSAADAPLSALGYVGGVEGGTPGGVPGGVVGGVVGGVSGAAPALEFEGMAAPGYNTESYAPTRENEFLSARDNPLSTFSIDVDTASYANVRRFLNRGQFPPRDAVRIEELINYFRYDYPLPPTDAPLSASVEVAGCPWEPSHRLARIGLRGREISRGETGASNLVFLIDVSGSMDHPAKLPLLKSAFALLVDELDGRDRVAIVVYAGAAGLVLPSTPGSAKAEILSALDQLQAGGSTNGGEGLRLAYRIALENFVAGGINRVVLATDGDFNVGVTSQGELLQVIEDEARAGVFLTVLGFGAGNYKDDALEHLADRGNGNYAYIDDLREARRVLVEQIGGTLVTLAKDVKIQVEFNPVLVESYRLIGYENRLLRDQDFNDDRKDAGEVGAGHTVTALYQIVPAGGAEAEARPVDPLRYQSPRESSEAAASGELLTVKVRFKEPEGDTSRLLTFPVTDEGRDLGAASPDFRFASAVAAFGLLLRDPDRPGLSFDRVRDMASGSLGHDDGGYRAEFLRLVDLAAVAAEGREPMAPPERGEP